MYIECKLPEYPVMADLWDTVANDKRPVMVYGMGNGADKLFERLARYGVVPAEVFASDGFVRGHKFRGYEVKSLSAIKEKYDDFLILLSFASNRTDVIDMIRGINSQYDMLIPDMPVAGEEYFDKEFYNSNYEEILSAYNALADGASKNAFAAMINYKLSGKAEYLFGASSEISEIYGLLPPDIRVAVDAGAYNGDTVRELLQFRPEVEKIYAFEPDLRNFKKLTKYKNESGIGSRLELFNAAVWNEDTRGIFVGSGNRNSSVSSTTSYKNKEESVELKTIDTAVKSRVDYIKYDVEGAELQALMGSRETLELYHPALLVSAYHRSEDIFSLVNYIIKEHPCYSVYIRRTLCFPAWEIAIIALEKGAAI